MLHLDITLGPRATSVPAPTALPRHGLDALVAHAATARGLRQNVNEAAGGKIKFRHYPRAVASLARRCLFEFKSKIGDLTNSMKSLHNIE